MPISESYVIQLLLQETTVAAGALQWREKETDGYVAHSRGVRLDLDNIMSRAGARKQLTCTVGVESVFILEPGRTGIFTEQYANEDDWRLVRLMRDLYAAAARQCAARRDRSEQEEELVRESIFRRLLGSDGEETESEQTE